MSYRLSFLGAGFFCFLVGINSVLFIFAMFKSNSSLVTISGLSGLMCLIGVMNLFSQAVKSLKKEIHENKKN